jgi:hypothetical protein
MIDKLDQHIIGVAIGIRYRANFSIEDQIGSITDKILYSKNAFFNEHIFPLTQNQVNAKILINDKTGDKLTVNNSNIVLELNFGNSFKKEDLPAIYENFNEQIVDGILKTYKITQITRIGIVTRYLFNEPDLSKSFIKKTIGGSFDGINDIDLRFSKKFPVSDSLVKKDIFDYENVIYNVIKRADKDELFVSLDFQKFFDPYLETSSGIKFLEFEKRVKRYNEKNFIEWINSNYVLTK